MANNNRQSSGSDRSTFLENLILGLARAVWWMLTLPFKKRQRRGGLKDQDRRYIQQKRVEISSMVQSDNLYEVKHAVIEADKLVDYVLQKKGYSGDSFANRLRSAERYMDHQLYQNLWDAHKIRNLIAHDEKQIGLAEIRRAAKVLVEYCSR